MTVPHIYIGPYSCILGNEVSLVEGTFQSKDQRSTAKARPILVDTDTLQRPQISGYCWERSTGRNLISSYTISILNDFRQLLESLEHLPLSIVIVADLGNGLAASLSSSLAEEIRGLYSSLLLLTVFLASEKLHGIYSLNSGMSTFYSLAFCDGVMIRDLYSSHVLINSEGTSNDGVDLRAMLKPIAYDLLSYCNNLAISDCKALDFLAPYSKTKIFDVRSSLWRAIRPVGTKAKCKSEYNQLRAMATNLHSAYISNKSLSGDSGDNVDNLAVGECPTLTCSHANIFNLTIKKSPLRIAHCVTGSAMGKLSDIKVALEWATPTVSWSRVSLANQARTLHLEQSLYAGTGSGSALLSLASLNLSTASQSNYSTGISYLAEGSRVPHADPHQFTNIAAIAFASPFGCSSIRRNIGHAQALLSKRAFLHKFEASGCEESDITDALEGILSYIDQ